MMRKVFNANIAIGQYHYKYRLYISKIYNQKYLEVHISSPTKEIFLICLYLVYVLER